MISRYAWNLLLAVDQLVNTVFGGDPDETISSRIGKWVRAGKHKHGVKRYVYKVTNFVVELFEKDHFAKSIEEDEGDDGVLK